MILPNTNIRVEVWKQIPQETFKNIKPIYYISTFGRLYNSETMNYLPKNIYYNKDKYITVKLSTIDGTDQYEQIHRLLMITFCYINNYDIYDVNHIDGVKYHNWLWNLEWCTRSENIQHALKNNLFNVGETRDNSILTNEQAHHICYKISEGKSPEQIEKEMGLPDCKVKTIVHNIIAGLSWKHISYMYDFSKAYSRFNFTIEQIHKICGYFETYGTDKSYKQVLTYLEIDYSIMNNKELDRLNAAICGIRSKKTYKNICSNYNY